MALPIAAATPTIAISLSPLMPCRLTRPPHGPLTVRTMRTPIRHLQGLSHGSHHATAHHFGATTHRARFGVVRFLPERLARWRQQSRRRLLLKGWSLCWSPAQFERVKVEGDRKSVHRGFERMNGSRGTRGPARRSMWQDRVASGLSVYFALAHL
jgi:hypothetical protein